MGVRGRLTRGRRGFSLVAFCWVPPFGGGGYFQNCQPKPMFQLICLSYLSCSLLICLSCFPSSLKNPPPHLNMLRIKSPSSLFASRVVHPSWLTKIGTAATQLNRTKTQTRSGVFQLNPPACRGSAFVLYFFVCLSLVSNCHQISASISLSGYFFVGV